MKFTVNTKPLVEALNLGIVDSNVSKFYAPSAVAKITISRAGGLVINLAADHICTRLEFKGVCDSEETQSIFVDSLKFKHLIATLETSTVVFEMLTEQSNNTAEAAANVADDASCLILHSGSSKFTLAPVLSIDVDINEPHEPAGSQIELKQSCWNFVKEHQLYLLSTSYIEPVYTNVWVGENGDVMTGDFDLQVYTHSSKSNLTRPCLLPYTIINMFNLLPDGATLYDLGSTYLVTVSTDSFSMAAEFLPEYEEQTGSYHADWILPMMANSNSGVSIKVADLLKILSQAELLSTSSETEITLSVSSNKVHVSDDNVNCDIEATGDVTPYTLTFQPKLLKSVISNCSEERIIIRPMSRVSDTDSTQQVMTGINIDSNELIVLLPATREVAI